MLSPGEISKQAQQWVAAHMVAPGVLRVSEAEFESEGTNVHLADLTYTRTAYQSGYEGATYKPPTYEVRAYFAYAFELRSYVVVISESHKFANAVAIELMFQAQLERQSLRGRE